MNWKGVFLPRCFRVPRTNGFHFSRCLEHCLYPREYFADIVLQRKPRCAILPLIRPKLCAILPLIRPKLCFENTKPSRYWSLTSLRSLSLKTNIRHLCLPARNFGVLLFEQFCGKALSCSFNGDRFTSSWLLAGCLSYTNRYTTPFPIPISTSLTITGEFAFFVLVQKYTSQQGTLAYTYCDILGQ